ncbi:hypothetical protein Agub_g14287 [Astrephomene gubernaculifera]|uniref:Alpha-aminoacylpeptide hydrolase n=1 Tax=Astrephomene gubernaculifera TaxID=47775 RepID=A0AAD3E185_9CHLO|nr:hypothetical protein Agub_g14287 [Astrephomene gubernaculifera]
MKREIASGFCRGSTLVLLLLLPVIGALQYPHPPPLSPPPSPTTFCNYSALYLPDLVTPRAYQLFLDMHFNPHPASNGSNKVDEYVKGYVNITISVAMPTQCLVINSSPGMQISSVTYFWKGKQYKGTAQETDPATLQTVLHFDEVLHSTTTGSITATGKAGSATSPYGLLNLEFAYRLIEDYEGLFKTSYKDDVGMHTIVTSQFQPAAARKAFPCFDEPRFKAPFRISIVTPTYDSGIPMATISNTKVANRTYKGAGSRVRTDFQPTPPLSAYSVVIVVGRFDKVERTCDSPQLEKPIVVRGWARKEKVGLFSVPLQVACSSLATLTSIFNVSYPLPELNMVALPSLGFGVAEGFGAILYTEAWILVDPSTADLGTAVTPILSTANPIALQWIGSMVTMSDWRDMWLKEAFATYLGKVAVDAALPALAVMQTPYMDVLNRAFWGDSSRYSRPLSGSEEEKAQYTSLLDTFNFYDDVTYFKSTAVIRMLRAYLNGRGEQQGAASVLGNGKPQVMRRRSVQQQQQQQQESEVPAQLQQEPDLAEEEVVPEMPERQQPQGQPVISRVKPASFQYGPMGRLRMQQAWQQLGLRQRLQRRMMSAGGEVDVTAGAKVLLAQRSRSLQELRRMARKLAGSSRATTATATTATATTTAATTNNGDKYGSDPFFAALRVFVKENLYRSVTPQTLWDTMSRATGLDISAWMYDWTYSANFPVVEVSLSKNATGTIVHADGSSAIASGVASTYVNLNQWDITSGEKNWWIPISYRLPDTSNMKWLQMDHEASVSLPLSNAVPPYVLVNPGRYGYYRVNYDSALWEALINAAKNTSSVPSGDLAAMIADSYQLVGYGVTPPEVFLRLAASLGVRQEPEFDAQTYTTGAILNYLYSFDRLTLLSEYDSQLGVGASFFSTCVRNLAIFTRDKIAIPLLVNMSLPAADGKGRVRVGVNFSSVDTYTADAARTQRRMIAPTVLELAAMSMVAAVKDTPAQLQRLQKQEPFKEAYTLRRRLGEKTNHVHADMSLALYWTNIIGNRGSIWEVTKKQYLAEKDPAERFYLLTALAHSRTVETVRNVLNLTLSMPPGDVETLFNTMGEFGGMQVAEIWNFVRQPENMDRLLALYGADSADASAARSLGQVLQTQFAYLPDDSIIPEIAAWAANYPGLMDPEIASWLQQQVEYNRDWAKTYAIPVCNWLDAKA